MDDGDGDGGLGGGSGSGQDIASRVERRRLERQRRDPHYAHPLRRIYVGPSPVSSGSAAKTAAALKQDALGKRHYALSENQPKPQHTEKAPHHREVSIGGVVNGGGGGGLHGGGLESSAEIGALSRSGDTSAGLGVREHHSRDISKQSRVSHAGTLNSVGTRFSEGSFGATGGFRSRLLRALGAENDQNGPDRSRGQPPGVGVKKKTSRGANLSSHAVRTLAHTHGMRVRVRGGVVPGAVGTSAGGTKWVGQSFEVGKRFWESIEQCETDLLTAEEAERANSKPRQTDVSSNAIQPEHTGGPEMARRGSAKKDYLPMRAPGRSPSEVLNTFARKADEATNEQTDRRLHASVEQSRHSNKAEAGATDAKDEPVRRSLPILDIGSADSEVSKDLCLDQQRKDQGNFSPSNLQVVSLKDDSHSSESPRARRGQPEGELARTKSQVSLLSVPEDRTVPLSDNIENRGGWDNVVNFISGQIGTKSQGMSDLRDRARQTLQDTTSTIRRRPDAAAGSANLLEQQTGPSSNLQSNAPSTIREVSPLPATSVSGKDDEHTDAEAGEGQLPGRVPCKRKLSSAATTFASARDYGSNETDLPDSEEAAKPMTRNEASQHPEPPLSAEERFPEATHALTRRVSNPGVAPDGRVNDGASDHQVAAHSKQILIKDYQVRHSEDTPRGALASAEPPQNSTARKVVQFQSDKCRNDTPDIGHSEYSNFGGRQRPAVRKGDSDPVPPHEVLARDPRRNADTADAAAYSSLKTEESREVVTSRSVLKRDRMLVRVAWTPSEDLPRGLTEHDGNKYPLHADPFREYMVVFRTGRLELWDDAAWSSQLVGHSNQLKLHLIAPLRRGRTFMSLYSPIDYIFCINFQLEAGHHRGLLNLRRSGTHVWIFDARSSTIAADWMWELWRELGGEIPHDLDVHVPALSVRTRIPIPEEMPVLTQDHGSHPRAKNTQRSEDQPTDDAGSAQFGEGYKIMTRANVVNVVKDLAEQVPQWRELTERFEATGVKFGLAWRNDNLLHWVQRDTTTDGKRRDWTVLVGAILSNSSTPSSLEFRAAVHYPHTMHTATGKTLREPPAIEGFLWRVKAASGALTRVYVSTHDGLLFVSRPSRAYPPERFVTNKSGPSPASDGRSRQRRGSAGGEETLAGMGRRVFDFMATTPSSLEEVDDRIAAFRTFERRRQLEQVSHADGYVDVRDICLIQCIEGSGPAHRPSVDEPDGSSSDSNSVKERKDAADGTADSSDAEDEDVGGEEGYDLAQDRAALKRRRQFEVTMSNGRTIRLEAYSRSVACEWMRRLTDIARYWKRREKIEALEMMSASGYDPALIQKRLQVRAEPRRLIQSLDKDRATMTLSSIWNWCVLDACRGIIRSGRLFTKKKPYSAFVSRYCILVGGRILTYKLMTSTRTARARQNAGIFHKRQETVIHLRDAYVYSGKLTDHMLVNGRSQGAGAITGTGGAASATARHTLPRIYGDGLLSVDEDEDCTFVIRYRPQRLQSSAAEAHMAAVSAGQHGHERNTSDPVDLPSASPQSPQRQQQQQPVAPTSVLPLQDKTVKHIAIRARSRLERDLWVWAINCERERLVREDRTREDQLRNQGQTPWKAH